MKIVIIDKKDIELNIVQNSIKVEEQTIPFKYIDTLVLNHRIKLNSKDIITLTKNNINILLISYNNTYSSIIQSANTKNAELKFLQYKSLENRLFIAKYFLKRKIQTHKEHLEILNIKVDTSIILSKISLSVDIQELLGFEGTFAREYFGYYFNLLPFNLHKNKRTKKPPLDPVNALLSFWYSIYYNMITIRLLSFGFEPSIGYLHSPFREHNALSSDILECFRSKINHVVFTIFKNQILTQDDFTFKNGVYLKYTSRQKIYQEFIDLVNILNSELDKEIANLKKIFTGDYYEK